MRVTIVSPVPGFVPGLVLCLVPGLVLGLVPCLAACGNSENAGAEEARREAEKEQKAKEAHGAAPAKRLATPVPGQAHVPCTQLLDLPAFQTALGEKEPLVIKDVTKTVEAAASCSLLRGGKRPSDAEQKAMLKRVSRLGVLPGDELCNITAFCWSIEDAERFKASCKEKKDKDDESMGSYACVHISPVGVDDVKMFTFFDEDTRCILQVRGGPSNVNNDMIQSCAKTARDTIGPAQIKGDAFPGGSSRGTPPTRRHPPAPADQPPARTEHSPATARAPDHRRRRRRTSPSTAAEIPPATHPPCPLRSTLQQPPPDEKKHTPSVALDITHAKPAGQASTTPGVQLCVQICCSLVPVQMPLWQNWG